MSKVAGWMLFGWIVLVDGASAHTVKTRTEVPAPGSAQAVELDAALQDETATRREAMQSVYFYALYLDDGFVDPEYRPMPLDVAIEVLREDRSWGAASRLQRALAKLYAAPQHPVRDAAIERLAAPSRAEAFDHRETLTRFDIESFDRTGHPETEQRVLEILERTSPPMGDCKRKDKDTDVDFQGGATTVQSTLKVLRPVSDLRKIMDPQSWDQCSPDHFKTTHVTDDLNPAPGTNPAPSSNPPQVGSVWSDVLYEHFVIAVGKGRLGWFKVLLDIETFETGTSYRVDYRLRKGLFGALGPLPNPDGGLAIDDGFIIAEECDGWACVKATKTLELEGWPGPDWGWNLMTSIGMRVLADENFEAVCCEATD